MALRLQFAGSLQWFMHQIVTLRRLTLPSLQALLVAVLLSGCGKPALKPLPDDAVILAFGDSLTDGRGVSRASAYPAILQTLINADGTGRTVVNAGISGETTGEGRARLPAVLDNTDPTLLILLEGGNDVLRNLDLQAAARNLDAMTALAKRRGIDVVLVGVPKKPLFSSSADFYQEIASDHDVPLQDDIIASLLRTPAMKSDSVHFNVNGYRALANAIHEVLDEHGAL